ncbi:MAG: hypothetical protein IPJ19_09650 [Planctomycetes bacterium]|nr:hypothetical protein [Planctomycetota bacterium]
MLSLLLALAAALPAGAADKNPSARAGHDSPAPLLQDEAAKLREELIAQLNGLAAWCNEAQLFQSRDSTWRSVLSLEPENAEARKGLRYSRDGQGNWKEPAPREVKDRNPSALPEFGKKRSEIVSAYRDAQLARLEKDKADPKQRDAVLDEVLLVDPDDALVHGLRGEARSGDKWVLAETAAAEKRRAELHGIAQKGRKDVPEAAKVPPTPEDLAHLPAWKTSVSSDGMHLLVQTSDKEAREMAELVHAACALAEGLCGKPMPPTDGFTVYVMTDPGEREKMLASLTDANDALKKSWKDAAGFGLPNSASVVLWDKDPKRRMDCFSRHAAASILLKGCHISSAQGWIFEGLGLYFSNELVGSRLTWFVSAQPGEHKTLRGRLFAPKTDWYAEALKVLKSPEAPKFAEMLGKDLSVITLEEMLVSYVFAAYLAEGQPSQLPEILTRVGAGESSVAVLEAVLARPLAQTQEHLVRWLEERH